MRPRALLGDREPMKEIGQSRYRLRCVRMRSRCGVRREGRRRIPGRGKKRAPRYSCGPVPEGRGESGILHSSRADDIGPPGPHILPRHVGRRAGRAAAPRGPLGGCHAICASASPGCRPCPGRGAGLRPGRAPRRRRGGQLRASSGKELWSYITGGAVQSSPAVAGGVVYVGSDIGKVYAFSLGG